MGKEGPRGSFRYVGIHKLMQDLLFSNFPFLVFLFFFFRKIRVSSTETNLSFQKPGIFHDFTVELFLGYSEKYVTPWCVTQL